jgi:WD40 repeat protein
MEEQQNYVGKFPLLCIDSFEDITAVGGGGGASKTGIANGFSILDCTDLSPLLESKSLEDSVQSLAFHPSGKSLLAITSNSIHLYDVTVQNKPKR